jgi:hypothetical protein
MSWPLRRIGARLTLRRITRQVVDFPFGRNQLGTASPGHGEAPPRSGASRQAGAQVKPFSAPPAHGVCTVAQREPRA